MLEWSFGVLDEESIGGDHFRRADEFPYVSFLLRLHSSLCLLAQIDRRMPGIHQPLSRSGINLHNIAVTTIILQRLRRHYSIPSNFILREIYSASLVYS